MQNHENSRFKSQKLSKLRFSKYLYHTFLSILKKNCVLFEIKASSLSTTLMAGIAQYAGISFAVNVFFCFNLEVPLKIKEIFIYEITISRSYYHISCGLFLRRAAKSNRLKLKAVGSE